MPIQSAVRQQVMVAIIDVMVDATNRGEDAWQAAERAFPGTPRSVLGEAWFEVEEQQTEAWWRTIERTIDIEVIRNAIVVTADEPAPSGSRDEDLDEAFAALVAGDARAA